VEEFEMDRVAFIGADPQVQQMVHFSIRLRWPDITPLTVDTAAGGLKLLEQFPPDVVLLHPDFQDMSLTEMIQQLRGFSAVPVLVLGCRCDEMEALTSLELGADDYVRLPCDLTELVLRVWALLRRCRPLRGGTAEAPIRSGPLLINGATYEAFLGDRRLALTTTEFRVLQSLVLNRGTVVTHLMLHRALWKDEIIEDSAGLVKKYIQRLRYKLDDDARQPRWIFTVPRVGYRFIGEPAVSLDTGANRPSPPDFPTAKAVAGVW
jgi:two-component system KDP operon response regulator KdpE